MSRATRILALFHLGAMALLLLLGYEWLGVGESNVPRLLWSAVVAILILSLGCWLYGTAFAFFRMSDPDTLRAVRVALRHLAALLTAVLAVILLYALLSWWDDYSTKPAFQIASWLTLKLRKPVKPAPVLRFFQTALWLVRWAVLPALLVPMVSGISARGFRGFAEFGWRRHSRLYRLSVPLLLIAAFWLPLRVMAWVPRPHAFGMQMLSFVLRISTAYLLFVAAGLVLAFLTSRGRPAVSQPSTVPSP